MKKLTAEKCREMFLHLFEDKRQDGITLKEDLYMQALEIALPILEQQEQCEGEWIEWKGGECPVDASTVVEIKWRFGATNTDNADCYDWVISDKENKLGDIIAYRIIATNHNGEQ